MRPFTRLICVGLSLLITAPVAHSADELLVYSTRNKSYIEPLLDEYSRETGIAVNYVIGSASALINRMQIEGKQSKADLFITADASNLWYAASVGVLAPVQSRTLIRNIPQHLRSPENKWFGLSKRARTIVYHTERVNSDELDSYEELGDPKWKGRLCVRSSQDEYSLSMVAMLIASQGKAVTERIVQGWVNNLATPPFHEDADILNAIRSGQCDVGIVNSYYFARLQYEQPATKLKLFWADQKGSGVQVNITGAGVTAHAPNKDQAIDLLEWMSTKKTQVRYSKLSMEYPANPKVYPPRLVGRWGQYKEDKSNVAEAGRLQQEAIALMKQANHM